MRHTWFIIIFYLLITADLKAQQDPQYSMFMLNTVVINPAYAGTRDALNVTLLNRHQWVGFPGAPVTQTLSAHRPILQDDVAMGISLYNDEVGPIRANGLFIDLAYRLKLRKANLSLGIKAGLDHIRGDLSALKVDKDADPSFDRNIRSRLLPNFGTGLYYYSEKFYLGLSIPRHLHNRLFRVKDPNNLQFGTQVTHAYLIGGYVFPIGDHVKFKPAFQARMAPNAPLQLDLNGSFLFYDRLWLGGFYRLQDAVGAMLQIVFSPQFRGAIAWDHTLSPIARYHSGSFEVAVLYDFMYKRSNIASPRYF